MFRISVWSLLGCTVLCSCSSSEKKPNSFLNALPQVAVASPTAPKAWVQRNASIANSELTIRAIVQAALPLDFFKAEAPVGHQASSLPVVTEMLRAMADATYKHGLRRIPLQVKVPAVQCFGRGVPYTNHPEGGPNSSTLGGETGFHSELETIDGISVACPAATMNQKVLELGGLVNQVLALTYLAAGEMHEQGQQLPKTPGQTIVAALPNAPSLSESRASVSLVSTYRHLWNLSATVTQNAVSRRMDVWLSHEQSETNEQAGRLWGVLPQGSTWYLFSLTYRVFPDRTLYELKTARSIAPRTNAPREAFSKDGQLVFDGSPNQQDLFYGVASLDSQSGTGDMKASWSASSEASHSRVFEISTFRGAHGVDEGIAYFGYAPNLTEASIASQTALRAQSMICSWSSGKKSFKATGAKAEHKGWVQAMQLVRNAESGQFVPKKDGVRLAYCPTQSCNGFKGMTYGNEPCEGPHRLARVGQYGRVLVEPPMYD